MRIPPYNDGVIRIEIIDLGYTKNSGMRISPYWDGDI